MSAYETLTKHFGKNYPPDSSGVSVHLIDKDITSKEDLIAYARETYKAQQPFVHKNGKARFDPVNVDEKKAKNDFLEAVLDAEFQIKLVVNTCIEDNSEDVEGVKADINKVFGNSDQEIVAFFVGDHEAFNGLLLASSPLQKVTLLKLFCPRLIAIVLVVKWILLRGYIHASTSVL